MKIKSLVIFLYNQRNDNLIYGREYSILIHLIYGTANSHSIQKIKEVYFMAISDVSIVTSPSQGRIH